MQNTRSSFKVENHVMVFFEKIFPKLSKFLKEKGEKMSKGVMVICPHG
jgi:hypothetical protein